MRKILAPVVIIALCSLLLIPSASRQPSSSQANETMEKQSLLKQDITMTDQLCRRQCALSFENMYGLLEQQPFHTERTKNLLQKMQNERPHMQQFIWTHPGTKGNQETIVGMPAFASDAVVRNYLSAAKKALKKNRVYQSPQIKKNGTHYFVMGVTGADHAHLLIGLVHQSILDNVQAHQTKNLRLVPYPREGKYKIKSVDSDTLQDVKVDDGEDNAGTSHYHKHQIIVKFKHTPTHTELLQIQTELQSAPVKKLGYTYVFESSRHSAEQMMAYFRQKDVEYAEPHFYYMTNDLDAGVVPDDALYSQYQWNLPIIHTEKGWSVTKGSKNVAVAVIDTGVDTNHPDLRNHLLEGFNALDDTKPPMDEMGHGTHVAGIISAIVNNLEGVAGMTWYNPILPVKVLDDTGAGNTYSVAQGIIWATDHGAKVINMSLGNYADAEFLHDAVKYAFNRDVVLVAASGNDNTDRPGYPAAYPEVLAVSAIDENQARAPFSNYGSYIDVMAPGVSIASTYPNNQYAALSGTSMASPHVAALAALIRSVNPDLKNTEVMDLIRQTAQDLGEKGKDNQFGFGQINVISAVQHAEQMKYSLMNWSNHVRKLMKQIEEKYNMESLP